MSQHDEILGRVVGPDTALVLTKRHVQSPVELILDRPVCSCDFEGPARIEIGEGADEVPGVRRDVAVESSFVGDANEATDVLPLLFIRDVTVAGEYFAAPPFPRPWPASRVRKRNRSDSRLECRYR